MISAWHLIWIIPLSVFAGAMIALFLFAMLVCSGDDDRRG